MTQKEFENRVGRHVSTEEYVNANSVYLASGMEKDEFCEKYLGSDKDLLLSITDIYYAKEKAFDALGEKMESLTKIILDIAYDGENTSLRNDVRQILGQRAFVRFCLEKGYELDQQDRVFVLDHLSL